jgi:thioredoxin-related protein
MLGVMLAPTLARAAELIMFERDGCPYCARWDRDVAPTYPLTDVGKLAPLRRINLDRQKPDVALAAPVRFTPTFVLMDEGREIGRITGYMDDAMFWGVFSKLAEKLAPASPAQER